MSSRSNQMPSNLMSASTDFKPIKSETESTASPSWMGRINWTPVLLLCVVELSIIIWNAFDHSLPCWDTAAHRLNSLTVYELLKKPQWANIDWYRSIFAVSPLYPPFFYFLSATLKFVLGPQAETDLVSNLIFVALTFISVYYTARVVFKSGATASLAAVLLFLYPFVYWSTHCVLLDCGATAMVALGLGSFIWWSTCPTRFRSTLLGMIFGLVVLTKNNTAIYLVGPMLIEAFRAIEERNKNRIGLLCLIILVAGIAVLPWAALAGPAVGAYMISIQSQTLTINDAHNPLIDFFYNLQTCLLVDFRLILSPLLYGCFLLALVKERNKDRNRLYLIASGVGGVILASGFRWLHSLRYVVPATVPMAIITADMLVRGWRSGKLWVRACIGIVTIIALTQFVYAAFAPYPIRLPGWINRSMRAIGAYNIIDPALTNPQGISFYPLPNQDWGALWALSIIERGSDQQRPTSVAVMPNTPPTNLSTFIYLARVHADDIRFVNSRNYTVLGDRVTFSKKSAMLVDWYILTTGDQGRSICNPPDLTAYAQWCDFVRSSGNFEQKGLKRLPDGSLLQVYRRISKASQPES